MAAIFKLICNFYLKSARGGHLGCLHGKHLLPVSKEGFSKLCDAVHMEIKIRTNLLVVRTMEY